MTSADCHLISASARFHMELWDLHSLCKQDAASLRAGSCALCTQRRLHNPACAGRVYIKRCTRSQLISLFGVGVWGGVGRSQDGTKYWWIRWRVAAAPVSKALCALTPAFHWTVPPPSLLMIFVSPTYKPQLIIRPSYPYMESIFSNGFGESLGVMLAIR